MHRKVYWNHLICKQKKASSNVNYIEKQEVELEGKKERTDIALVVFKFSLLDVWLMRIVEFGLEEDRGVLDSGSTKPYRGLNLDPLCSCLHAGDRGLDSLGLSVVQCIRKAAVVLPSSQKHRRSLKQPKKKESFHEIFCIATQTVVYDPPGIHKTSNSQTISYPRSLCHRQQQHKSNWFPGVETLFKGFRAWLGQIWTNGPARQYYF